MKRVLILICLCLIAISALPSSRNLRDAKSIAAAFAKQTVGFVSCEDDDFIAVGTEGKRLLMGLSSSTSDYYILNISNGNGYVIVSGDDRFRDVIGYSTTGHFSTETAPTALTHLLSTLSAEMQAAKEYYDENGITTIESDCSKLTSGNSISPLIKTHWYQGYPFNSQVPVDYSGNPSMYHGKASVGCVALAMAQVMNYWKYPSRGQGGTYANTNYSQISVNFSEQTYNWNNIAKEYGNYRDDDGVVKTGQYTQSQADEVAKICYHIGVAVDMIWNVDGLGSSGTVEDYIPRALANQFGYNKYAKIRVRDVLGVEEFKKEIINDLSVGRPVIFNAISTSGGGHSFILDGYDASTDMFHANWGWQGTDNGYYAISVIKPASSDMGNFVCNQDAVLGVQPTEEDFGFQPSLYGCKLTLDRTSISKGENLKVLIDTLYDYDFFFEGKIGFAVYDANGELKLDNINTQIEPGLFYINNAFYSPIFPRSMTAGTYTMRMVMKDTDGTIYPLHAKYGNTESWTVTVSSSTPSGVVTFVADPPVATGIENVEITSADTQQKSAGDDAWYTLTGTRVAQPGKGVYIHNGKKYVFR